MSVPSCDSDGKDRESNQLGSPRPHLIVTLTESRSKLANSSIFVTKLHLQFKKSKDMNINALKECKESVLEDAALVRGDLLIG